MKRALILILMLLLITYSFAYDNPITKNYVWDDSATNQIFDIKTDKQTYNELTDSIVYIQVTNLTNSKQDLNLSSFFNKSNVTINNFSEWKDINHTIVTTNNVPYDYNFLINKSDLNSTPKTCANNNALDFNLNYCYRVQTRYNEVTNTTYSVYPDWKTSKAQAWITKPFNLKNGFDTGGQLATINVGKNEIKYFVLSFNHKPSEQGEFEVCANNDCLDPWWNASYTKKYPVTISGIHTAFDTNMVIRITNLNTSGWDCAGDNNKMSIVYQNGASMTELDMDDINGTCGGTMMVAWRSQYSIPANVDANGTDTNGYWIYTRTTTITNPLRNKSNIYQLYDGFESGNLTYWTAKNWGACESASTTTAAKGIYSLKWIASCEEGLYRIFDYNKWEITGAINIGNIQRNSRLGDMNKESWANFIGETLTSTTLSHWAYEKISDGTFGQYQNSNTTGAWVYTKIDFLGGNDYNGYMYDSAWKQTDQNLNIPVPHKGRSYYVFLYGANQTGILYMDEIKAYQVPDYAPTYGTGAVQTNSTDSCTYSGSGDWTVALSDNCNLTTDTNLGSNKFYTSGTGTLTINAWIRCNEAHLIGNTIHWMGKGFGHP